MKYDDAIKKYDPVIGIEVHVELGTATKMFDAAPNTFGGGPNSNITPTSLGLPGSLPVVNAKGVEYAIRIGLALGCEIAESCRFARKNYFYPDVPKDFQTSQYDEPIAAEGSVEIELEDGTPFTIPIERAHMEEDAGKNTHVGGATGRIHGADHSLVDYNRAGVPLVEIVTHPITGTGERA
ncbi:Asp-tRNA(Asn)/Glu-tRNA(Gln) amidotransferase GatCAB subunit B, partial [Burkholderia multivorans]